MQRLRAQEVGLDTSLRFRMIGRFGCRCMQMWLVLRAMFTRNERGDDVYVIELTRLSVFSVFRTCHIDIV